MKKRLIANVNDLAPGQMKPFSNNGNQLLLVNAEGRFHVVDELCSHEDFSLSYGCIKGGRIKCSLHGSYFDLKTGQPLDEPATDPLGVYQVEVENDKIYLIY